MKHLVISFVLAVVATGASSLAQADSSSAAAPSDSSQAGATQVIIANPIPPPQTKIEKAVQLLKGAVIFKGYTDVGEVQADNAATIKVTAVQLNVEKDKEALLGVAVSIRTSGSRTAVSFVDYDEMDGLISALDTLGKLQPPVTSLANYEGEYRTRGNVQLSNIDENGGRVLVVRTVQILDPSGQIIWSTATMRPARAAEIKQQLVGAKQMLDKIKNPEKPPAE
jgi:hypothetical protein